MLLRPRCFAISRPTSSSSEVHPAARAFLSEADEVRRHAAGEGSTDLWRSKSPPGPLYRSGFVQQLC